MDALETTRVYDKSARLIKEAAAVLYGGLGSTLDARYGVSKVGARLDGSGVAKVSPVFAKGKGALLFDVDGNEYIDYVGANGALVLGHADERVVAAINKAAAKGCSFGSPSDLAVRLFELLVSRLESIDLIVPTHSPTEALLGSVSLARRRTGLDLVFFFDGFWHGSVIDPLALGGTDESITSGDTKYNDSQGIERFFEQHATQLAAVVVEPGAVSRGVIPPADGFLQTLRDLCDQSGTLLIYDETLTGFRLAPGGAAEFYRVRPDLTILGPLIGGGLSLAAYGGAKDLMKSAWLQHPLLHPNPLSGNLLAVAAGVATLEAIGEPGFHADLEARATRLEDGLVAAASAAAAPLNVRRVANIVGLGRALGCDQNDARFAKWFGSFYRLMFEQGILLSPTPELCLFVSAAHGDDEIDRTIEAARAVMSGGMST